jgi:hypothetical protein
MASGYKAFVAATVLDAADLTDYCSSQAVMRFANAAARDAALTVSIVKEGMVAYLQDTNVVQVNTDSTTTGWKQIYPVITAGITDGQITNAKMASDSVASANIIDGTIVGGDIATGTITGANILDRTITNTDIALDTIQGFNIAPATITASNIAAATITGSNIAAGTITGANILDRTITNTDIALDTIQGFNIAPATITASNIAAATITGSNIAAGTITGSNILDRTITNADIALNTIEGFNIALETITGANIQDGSIGAQELVNGGTYPINVTGNAGTASNAALLDGFNSSYSAVVDTIPVRDAFNRIQSQAFITDDSTPNQFYNNGTYTQIGQFTARVVNASTVYSEAVTSARTVLINSAGTLGTSVSSRRYKVDIETLKADTDKILQLEPVTFYYLPEMYEEDQDKHLEVGLIAEQAAELGLEELVHRNPAGDPEGIAYEKLAVYLLKVCQTQQTQIDALSARLDKIGA